MAQLEVEVPEVSSMDYPTPPPTLKDDACWKPATSSAEPREMGTDRTETGEKIKRPMNAFMVWAQIRRAEITQKCEKVHNSLVSKALGAEWKTMSAEQKEPFIQRAKELRDELFREHPNYVYRPRKRKHRSAVDSPSPTVHSRQGGPPPAKISAPTSGAERLGHATLTNSKQSLSSSAGQQSLPNVANMLLYPSMNSMSIPLANNFLNPILLNQLIYNQFIASQLLQK